MPSEIYATIYRCNKSWKRNRHRGSHRRKTNLFSAIEQFALVLMNIMVRLPTIKQMNHSCTRFQKLRNWYFKMDMRHYSRQDDICAHSELLLHHEAVPFGTPSGFLTNIAQQFVSRCFISFSEYLSSKPLTATAYRSQAKG